MLRILWLSLKEVYGRRRYIVIFGIVFVISLSIQMYLLLSKVPWNALWINGSSIYNLLQLILNVAYSVVLGVAVSMFFYIIGRRKRIQKSTTYGALSSTVLALIFTGCYVCGVILLPILGMALSVAVLPLRGLEIKILALLLLVYSVYEFSLNIAGTCSRVKKKVIELREGRLIIYKKWGWAVVRGVTPFISIAIFLGMVLLLPRVSGVDKVNFEENMCSIQEN